MKKHKHAELMKLYAEDAMETDTPYLRWQSRETPDCEWKTCGAHPGWSVICEYRRKPDAKAAQKALEDALAFAEELARVPYPYKGMACQAVVVRACKLAAKCRAALEGGQP